MNGISQKLIVNEPPNSLTPFASSNMETPWTGENPFKISMKCWFQIDLKFLDQIKSDLQNSFSERSNSTPDRSDR